MRGEVVEIQRARLLAAAVRAVEEQGYTQTTVAHITRHARVSRRTFYELFDHREACLLAVLDDALAAVRGELDAAGVAALPWRERIRTGLAIVLALLDREPALARFCVVQSLRGGPEVLARREQVLSELAAVLDESHRAGARGGEWGSLTAEGLVGAIFGIVHGRLLRGEAGPLLGLLGELMAAIVLPHEGVAAARRELARPAPTPAPRAQPPAPRAIEHGADPLAGLRMRMTYRTARVLRALAAHPGASNRQVGTAAEIADQGQVSKLLARLARLGLVANANERARGLANAWALTATGAQLERSLKGRM